MKKRLIAFLLCFALVLPILPVNAVTVDEVVCTCGTETETHTETCDLYVAPTPTCSCDAAEGAAHKEGCALYVAPVATAETTETTEAATEESAETTEAATEESTETTEAATEESTETTVTTETTESTEPDAQLPVGTPVGYPGSFNVDGLIVVYSGVGKGAFPSMTGIFPKSFTVEMQYTDAEGTVWYKLSSPEWPVLYSHNVFVKAEIVDVEIPESDEIVYAEKSAIANGVAVNVSGNMPENVSLSVLPIEYATYGARSSVVGAFDISLLNPDGSEWQPEDGKIGVTLDAASMGLADGSVVNIHHEHGDDITVMSNYLVLDGKISFTVSGFSIFVVENLGVTTGTQVAANNTYTMVAGQPMEIFYWVRNTQAASVEACIWHVSDPDGAISYTVHERTPDALNDYRRYAPYIQVTPVKVGTATLTMEYVLNNNNINRETFTIQVVAPEEFHIADKVAENGCLVPTWRADGEDLYLDNVTYQWERSDEQTIRAEALNSDGSVNISKDRGGVTNSRGPITYTVTVTDAAGNVYTDSYQVLYGNEILNPGFETPVVPAPATYDGGAHARFYNGYPGLYWKTTAPGATGNQLTQDVEIVRPSLNAQNYHGVNNPAEGQQFAEVNAEQFGTLYQDMLTTPGAEFTWSFSHAARNAGQNTIYVVVAGTEYAQEIVGFAQIDAILDKVRNQNIPQTGEGYLYRDADGNEYRIWRHTATYNSNPVWNVISGQYTVPEGQYLTRLFFASETSGGDNTQGNLIDGVNAGEQMTYRIEYYPDDVLDATKTQRGSATVYTAVTLQHLQEYLNQQYVVTNVTVNGVSYPNDISDGLYISDYGKSNENDAVVLKVYLKKQAITVTKKVAIEGWTAMNSDQRDALLKQIEDGYTAEFGLFTGETQVAQASVTITTIPESGEATAVCEFNKTPSGDDFKPALGVSYTVKENSASSIDGYLCTTTYSVGQQADTAGPVNVTLSSDSPNAEVTCTNAYEPGYADLTIVKTGNISTYDVNQSFIFHVVDNEDSINVDMKVVINGTGNVTIKNLPVGTYTVTELDNWSWRYNPDDAVQSVEVSVGGGNSVTFNNSRDQSKWLDGDSYNENQYTVTGAVD